MSKVLGLDLGPNSIGWALLDPEEEKIIATGVRIFEEGLNRQGGREESKNATRRASRQARRLNARRRSRTNKLIYLIIDIGLYPESDEEVSGFHAIDPYHARPDGLNPQLTHHELGTAVNRLNTLRGLTHH